jgi:hypothetical protein
LSSPVSHSHPESRLTPSAVVKGSAATDARWLRSTSSLPWNDSGNRSQPTATVFARLGRFRGRAVCQRLPRVAAAGLHKGSTLVAYVGYDARNWTSASAGAFAKRSIQGRPVRSGVARARGRSLRRRCLPTIAIRNVSACRRRLCCRHPFRERLLPTGEEAVDRDVVEAISRFCASSPEVEAAYVCLTERQREGDEAGNFITAVVQAARSRGSAEGAHSRLAGIRTSPATHDLGDDWGLRVARRSNTRRLPPTTDQPRRAISGAAAVASIFCSFRRSCARRPAASADADNPDTS